MKINEITKTTWTVYKYDVNTKKISNRENLNHDELDSWMESKYGKFPAVKVIDNMSKKSIIYIDNGKKWEKR